MSNPQDPLAVLRNRLLTRYNQLLSEHTFTWSQILENTTRCAKLIEEVTIRLFGHMDNFLKKLITSKRDNFLFSKLKSIINSLILTICTWKSI